MDQLAYNNIVTMDILENLKNKEEISSNKTHYNLDVNNKRLNVIMMLEENPTDKLKEIFHKIISGDDIENGHYQLQNLFTLVKSNHQDAIINLIIDVIDKKIKTMHDTIYNENGELDPINLSMYIQLWEAYRAFTHKIYHIINHYQHYLVEKNIKVGNISYDILSVIQICMFYDGIIGKNSSNDNVLTIVSEEIADIDKKNIEQLIDYIDCIRTFIIMNEFTNINKDKLIAIIKNIMGKTAIVNTTCFYMNQLLKKLTNKQAVLDETEYETTSSGTFEKTTIRKIYKIATVLSLYADKKSLLHCYKKFMQIRIIDPTYDNLELEIELVRRISGTLGKDEAQKFIDNICDIITSRKANELIHEAEINVKTDEYKTYNNPTILNPIILTKSSWGINNSNCVDLNYPMEIKCYLEMISKSYHSLYDGEYIIEWQSTMGYAQFEAILDSKKVDITCNILQAILLSYLNDNNKVSINQFAKDTYLNKNLAAKIFESLFEENIIISADKQKNSLFYIINTMNYTGDTKLDIRSSFVKTFQVENDDIPIAENTTD